MAHNLAFEDVFAMQFRISRYAQRPLPGFEQLAVGQWTVEVGTKLPVISVRMHNIGLELVLLGIAVDVSGFVVTSAHIKNQHTAHEIIDYLNTCSGRFAYLIVSNEMQRFYGDPSGGLGAVYNPEIACVAATLNLAICRDPIPNGSYPLTGLASVSKARFAFGHTADHIVKRLIPNHFLDLTSFCQSRFWPTEEDIEVIEADDEAALLSRISARLEEVVAALCAHFPNTKLPISGGLDSRVLLATAKPVLDQLTLYSHAENMMSRRDTRIAAKLAATLNSGINIYDPTLDPKYQISDQATLDALSQANHIAVGNADIDTPISKVLLEVLQAVPEGGLVLRANLVDFLKAVLWRRGVAEYTEGTDHNIRMGLRMMMLSDRATMRDLDAVSKRKLFQSYEGWYSGLTGLAAKRPFDMMFSEQFLSHGLGNQFYAYTRNFYICPFNDRRLLSWAMSLPPDRRARFHYTEAIIADRAPELQQMKYTRKSTTTYVRGRQKEGLNWYASRE